MILSAWLFVGAIAFLWTLVTLGAAALADPRDTQGDGLTIIGGTIGFVLWGVWTYGTLEISVVSNGTELTFVHPELTILGVAMALIPGYLALTGPIELINRAREPRTDEI